MKKSVRNLLFLICVSLLLTGVTLISDSNSLAASRPAKIKISSVASPGPSTTRMAVKWKKVKCKGYQVQYSTDKKFKKKVKKVFVSSKKKAKTISKLKSNKKYYIRVRAYNKKNKKKLYGKWSKKYSCVIHKHDYKLLEDVPKDKIKENKELYVCFCGREKYVKVKKPQTEATAAEPTYEVTLSVPENTVSNTSVNVTGTNNTGFTYNYTLFKQNNNALMTKYKKYLTYHGCSTCSLTTILRATVPELADYTPDRVITDVIKPVVGETAFNKNFNKAMNKQMPIGLKGMSKVLSAHGVEHKVVYSTSNSTAIAEITEHLKTGNPIIFTSRKSIYTDSSAHTMIMLGLDENGKVIVGDSCHRKESVWGKHRGQVKYSAKTDPNCNTVEKIVSYFKFKSAANTPPSGYFYTGTGNNGYILIYK